MRCCAFSYFTLCRGGCGTAPPSPADLADEFLFVLNLRGSYVFRVRLAPLGTPRCQRPSRQNICSPLCGSRTVALMECLWGASGVGSRVWNWEHLTCTTSQKLLSACQSLGIHSFMYSTHYAGKGDVASYYFWSCIPFLWILCSFMMYTDYCTGFSFYFILLYNSHNIDPNHSVKVIMNYIFNMFHKLHRYKAYYSVPYLICGTGTIKGVKATLNFIIVLSDFISVVLETAEWLVCHLLCRTRDILVRWNCVLSTYENQPWQLFQGVKVVRLC